MKVWLLFRYDTVSNVLMGVASETSKLFSVLEGELNQVYGVNTYLLTDCWSNPIGFTLIFRGLDHPYLWDTRFHFEEREVI